MLLLSTLCGNSSFGIPFGFILASKNFLNNGFGSEEAVKVINAQLDWCSGELFPFLVEVQAGRAGADPVARVSFLYQTLILPLRENGQRIEQENSDQGDEVFQDQATISGAIISRLGLVPSTCTPAEKPIATAIRTDDPRATTSLIPVA